jgi:hypothetical protein
MLSALHEPMTLEQLRRSLVERLAVPQTAKPSLKETLDWLNENMSLAADHEINAISEPLSNVMGPTEEITTTTAPVRFDSCTIVFDSKETRLWGPPTFPKRPEVRITRYTIPLGALTGGSVIKSRTRERWTVGLVVPAKDILAEKTVVLYATPPKTQAIDGTECVFLTFTSEGLAQRVLEAFHHAADLCRKKEPF